MQTRRSPRRGSSASLAAASQSPAAPKLAACLAYGAVSVSITLFNKAVFSVYRFEYPAFVTTLQVGARGRDWGVRRASAAARRIVRRAPRAAGPPARP